MDKRLLDCEWILLRALWGKPPRTMKQIVEWVRTEWPDIQWSYKTYHTYLRKMEEKGLIVSETRNLKDKMYSSRVTPGGSHRCGNGKHPLTEQLFRFGGQAPSSALHVF